MYESTSKAEFKHPVNQMRTSELNKFVTKKDHFQRNPEQLDKYREKWTKAPHVFDRTYQGSIKKQQWAWEIKPINLWLCFRSIDKLIKMFVGLENHGATCYMNALLQTLFFIPEVKNWILKYEYSSIENKEEDCIPLQLQLLFAQMELSSNYQDFLTKLTCSTSNLTKAFQWDFNEQF